VPALRTEILRRDPSPERRALLPVVRRGRARRIAPGYAVMATGTAAVTVAHTVESSGFTCPGKARLTDSLTHPYTVESLINEVFLACWLR